MTRKMSRLTSIFLPLHISLNLLLLSPVLAALDAGSCAFPNGQQAAGYAVCDPTASQSSCCLEGEACLQDGLCYGAIGFMYRGACAGGWGNSTACPDYCATVAGLDGSWANLLPCYSNDSAPSYNPDWWCGLDTACNLDVANAEPTRNAIFTLPFTGKAAAVLLSNGTTSSGCSAGSDVTTTGTASNSTATATVTVTASPSGSSDGSCGGIAHTNTVPTGAVAGIAVLGVLAVLSLGWALWENRARRRQGRAFSKGISSNGYGQAYHDGQIGQGPPSGTKSGGAGGGNYWDQHEMEARTVPGQGPGRAVEMDGRKTVIAEM